MVAARGPEYTVAITSVDGLDPALDLHSDRQVLSPVFGITVHIDNTHNQIVPKCVGGVGSSAIVSYGEALLAKGAVPELCVHTSGVGEVAAEAWGLNVQVPQFLRDRLAGELESGQAVVDVAVEGAVAAAAVMETSAPPTLPTPTAWIPIGISTPEPQITSPASWRS